MLRLMERISESLAWLLSFYYDLWPWDEARYGAAVIMLTLTVMVAALPLTYKGTKSMISMQRLQPEIQRIRSEFKDDPQQMNQEMVELYQRHNVNPLGCMTQFIQLPIFLALYQVILGLTRRVSRMGMEVGNAAPVAAAQGAGVGGEALVPPIRPLEKRTFNPAYLSENDEMRQDLLVSTEMPSFGIDLADNAWSVLQRSFVDGLPYLFMIAIVAASGWYQQRQIMARNPGAARNPQQVMISRMMLIFLPLISFRLQAAVVVYFVTSNLFRVGQQWFITRSLYAEQLQRESTVIDTEPVDEKPVAEKPEPKPKPKPKPKPSTETETKPKPKPTSDGSRHGQRRPTKASKPRRTERSTPKPTKPGGADSSRVTPKGQSSNKRKKR